MSTKEVLKSAAGTLGENVVFEGLLKKEGRLKTKYASGPEDVLGFDYWVHWDSDCYEFYSANPPLIGTTRAMQTPCPLGIATFDDYSIDYERAIELFHTGNWGGEFTSISLSKPLSPQINEPYWHFVSDLGVEVAIGANSGEFLKDFTKEINVHIGDIFNVDLKGNETTGYSWVLAKLPSNLYLLDEHYTVDPHKPGMLGVGGTKTFVFKAVSESAEGDYLEFKEMHPGMSKAVTEKTFKVNVNNKIQYEHISDYIVGNDVTGGEQYLVIKSLNEFEKYFHPAAVMYKKQRWINESDFDNHYVMAKIEPTENMASEYVMQDIDISNDILEVKYKVNKTEITWTGRWCSVLLVEKGSYTDVAFIENGEQKAGVTV